MLFGQMLAEGIAPNSHTLTIIVRLLGQACRADKAFDLVENLTHKYRLRASAQVCNALIQACILNQDLSRAMSVFEHMANGRMCLDSATRQSFVLHLLASGGLTEAVDVLRAVLMQ